MKAKESAIVTSLSKRRIKENHPSVSGLQAQQLANSTSFILLAHVVTFFFKALGGSFSALLVSWLHHHQFWKVVGAAYPELHGGQGPTWQNSHSSHKTLWSKS